MLSRFTILAAASALLSLASAAPTVAAGEKLRGVTDPIFHLYLQVGEDGTSVVVAAEATAGEFTITESVQETTSGKYLNVQEADTSFKPLAFGAQENFSGWGLEGDTLITTDASEYGRQLNFLACETETADVYQMYLQTGGDMPEGSCTSQTLHLPCLC
ncbi:hypothetical protein FQN54_008644 [Arachnomyces sp. PD_36]|nr:hypothetical protein FQN54_008644 [Arachnomyces sp. PD_36]